MLNKISFYLVPALLLVFMLSNFAFAQSEKKVAYGVLIDNTGSLRPQFPQVRMLGKGVVRHTHQRGPISLFNFMTQGNKRNLAVVTSGVEWSQNQDSLNRYIDSLAVEAGRTTLMDAIHSIAERLNAKVSLDEDAYAGKAIILITDGEDRVSKVKEKELVKALKDSGIKVYAVGLIRELDSEGGFIRKSSKEKAEKFLNKITKETGGRVIFPKSSQTDIDNLLSELLAG